MKKSLTFAKSIKENQKTLTYTLSPKWYNIEKEVNP